MDNMREDIEHTDSIITRTTRRIEQAYSAALGTSLCATLI